jgi:cytochrome c-type biogenesis protein CcmH
LYIKLGSTQALQPDELVSHAPPSGGDGKTGDAALSDKQILAMVDALAQKMEKNPADPKGWILLARSQSALGRFPEAVAAYEKAVKLLPNDATLYADFADALVMQQEGSFEGKPQMLIRKALELDPNYPKALALAGTAEMRLGNKTASLKHWEKLKTVVAQGSDDYRQVESIIAEVKGEKVDSIPLIQSASAPAAPAQPSPQTPSAAMQRQAAASQASPPVQAPAGNAAGAKITGKVTLSPDVASKLAATDTLFIFARAKEGPRMPLAVLKLPAPRANEFPKSFELTDAMAMAPGLNLSSFKEVIIEARVSKSGNAQLQSGDLNGVSSAVAPGAGNVVVTIAKVAP